MVEEVCLVDGQHRGPPSLGCLACQDVPCLDGEGGGAVDGPAAEGGDDVGEDAAVILSFRVSQGCDLRRPVVNGVADGTLTA